MDNQDSQPLLQLHNGYWIGIDGEIHLEIPSVLFRREVHLWLEEHGYSTAITMEEAGARAEAYNQCRMPSYWRPVTDPRVRRTPISVPDHQTNQDKDS